MNLARLKSDGEKKWPIGNVSYIISDFVLFFINLKSKKLRKFFASINSGSLGANIYIC